MQSLQGSPVSEQEDGWDIAVLNPDLKQEYSKGSLPTYDVLLVDMEDENVRIEVYSIQRGGFGQDLYQEVREEHGCELNMVRRLQPWEPGNANLPNKAFVLNPEDDHLLQTSAWNDVHYLLFDDPEEDPDLVEAGYSREYDLDQSIRKII